MQKQLVDKFIRKYNLGGNIESVKWSVNDQDKTLKVAAKSEDRNTVVYVELTNFDGITDTIDFGVYETKKLRQLMGVFDQSFDVTVNKKGDEIGRASVRERV